MDSRHVNVLLIEDNVLEAQRIQVLLGESRTLTCTLVWAEQLAEGLNYLRQSGFDVVLLDLDLPDSPAKETYKRVQSGFDHVPVVPLVNLTTGSLGIHALRAGAQDCLIKEELNTELLSHVIHHAIERQQADNRFQHVIKTIVDGIIIINDQGLVRFVNPAAEQLFGRSAAEICDTYFGFPLVQGESTEIDILRPDGAPVVVDMRVVEMPWEGEPAYLAALRDITDRKQAEIQALELALEREKVKLLRGFIQDLSHDFRTPLATINSSVYLLERTVELGASQRYVHQIENQVGQITRLVDSLLEMSNLDGGIELDLEILEVNNVLRQVEGAILTRAQQKNIQVTCRLSDTPFYVEADAFELVKALVKIADNGVQFTLENGQLELEAAVDGTWARITIRDTGMGIAPTDLPHIFERFYRGDKARNSRLGGPGLGLAIARTIIGLHRGTIQVESREGTGSQFTVRLPLVP